MIRRFACLALLLAAGCRPAADHGPVEVSVIGPALDARTAPDPDAGPLDAPAAALALATRQGLLRFDAAGQVVPGLAARWIVSSDGRSLIFRLPDEHAPFGSEVVATRLRQAIAGESRNPLKPLLGAVTEIDPVTPQVVDVELRASRPNLLQLFAQPALSMTGPKAATGPFRLAGHAGDALRLRQIVPPPDDPDARPPAPETVLLRGERAGTAVARFRAGRAALVLGGTFDDLAVARAASPAAAALHFDPVQGLFGLAFAASGQPLVADADNRRALAMAIDRDRLARLFAVPGWTEATAIVAAGTPEIALPATPDWAASAIDARRMAAQARIAAWRAAGGVATPVRVALPAGPGGRLLFAAIAADWRAIGVEAQAVAPGMPADLTLVDEVAPTDSAAFYLRRFACDRGVPCTETADRILIAAREADTPAERTVLLTQADALIAATVPFVALGMPVRWALVAPELDRYRDSPRGLHPLDELRSGPR